MKRIFYKNLEKEIQKVASYSKDKQHCLDILYDHNRKEQDFFLEQMNLFNIKDKELRLYGHFSFSVKQKLKKEIVSKELLHRIIITIICVLKEKSLQRYNPSSQKSDKHALVKMFVSNMALWLIELANGDLDELCTILSHLYEENEYGLGILHINLYHWLKKSAKYCKEKIAEMLHINN